MGDKASAKSAAVAANCPVVPGSEGVVETEADEGKYHRVICDCGDDFRSRRDSLLNGRSTQCRKCASRNRSDKMVITVGERFSMWTVLEDLGNEEKGNRYVRARCEGCQAVKDVSLGNLKSGASKSCKTCAARRVADASRRELPSSYGQWKVIAEAERSPGGQRRVEVECQGCGTSCLRFFSALDEGRSTGCALCAGKKDRTVLPDGTVLPKNHTLTDQGYVRVSGLSRGLLHRLVMEELLGRKLLSKENVHHVNGVRWDNRPENLELWSSSQPPGQRVSDKVAWAKELLALYEPEALR